MPRVRGHLGLLGRIIAILLLTVLIEFGVSTFLYERAGRFAVREDEARRLAEHLVIARKLVSEAEPGERIYLGHELSTDRYDVSWSGTLPPEIGASPELETTRRQIISWEPQLARSALRLRLASPGRTSAVVGALRLPQGDWLLFRTHPIGPLWDLALGRVAFAMVPAIALFILGGLMIRRTLTPLRQLVGATKRVGLGSTELVPEGGAGEVRLLIRAFNRMQHRIHALIEDRTNALAAVGHDLRTPLARVQLRAEAIPDEPLRLAIGRDIGEMEAMVASLLAFLGGEDDPEPREATDIAVLAATIADEAADAGHDVRYEGPPHAEIGLRRSAMRRAITNLVENAIHYGGAAVVRLDVRPGAAVLRIEDDGPGIPEDRLEEVLRPFTRLDRARARNTKGLGLGLSIVARAVEREGGTLSLENRVEGGLRVRMELPR